MLSLSNPSLTDWNSHEINLGGVSYPYFFGYDCLPQIADTIVSFNPDMILVVTDDTVFDLHGAALLDVLAPRVPVEVLRTPAGESTKTSQVLMSHLERAIAAGATRRSMVVAFGGGVPGNLAGVIAALLFRGIRLVHIPTTTMAAMDSTISLKQAINSAKGKNHIGTYHTPTGIFADVKLMQTLPPREIRSGLVEAIKNCFAILPEDIPEMRAFLAAGQLTSPEGLIWMLERSIHAKMAVTQHDAREQKSGLILEYGHTVGHAIEMCDHRLRGVEGLSHGEAVALGMLAGAHISAEMCGLPADAIQLHRELLVDLLGAPALLPEGITTADVMRQVMTDNKRGYLDVTQDEAAMVLLRNLGDAAGTTNMPLVAVPLALVQRGIEALNLHMEGKK